MVTKEQLLQLQELAIENIKPIREEFKKCQLEYDNKIQEMEKPLLALLEVYYDENLKDKKDQSVRKGNTITNGKSNYYVHDRGMQFVFGTMLFNPRIICKKIDEKGYSKPNAKDAHIPPSELKGYWII